MKITAERLRQLLEYNPETGVFTRRVGGMGGRKAGGIAGAAHRSGYVHIKIEGRVYKAHRLAWLYVHGVWPDLDIDHRNRKRDDNRIANLREATRSENPQNRLRARRDSSSGLLGVSFDERSGTWKASITLKGRRRYLGRFHTAEAAHAAYLAAKARLHPFMEEPNGAGPAGAVCA